MTSVVFNPRVPLIRKPAFIPASIDKMLDEFFSQDWPFGHTSTIEGVSRPMVNIRETDSDFCLAFAAPGLEKSDFKIAVNKDLLTVSVEKAAPAEETGKILRREFGFFNFQRSFRLPNSVDVNAISATYNNGILEVTLPKREEARVKPPIQIEIA